VPFHRAFFIEPSAADGEVVFIKHSATIVISEECEKQIPCGNDRQEKQRKKQILRCAQDDKLGAQDDERNA